MNWQVEETGQVTFFTGVAEGISSADALAEMWELLLTEVLPLNEGIDWDYLRVEFWADSGRIILFPASSEGTDRIEKAGCQLVLPKLLETYEKLADSNLSDDAFTEQLTFVQDEWANSMIQAAKGVSLPRIPITFWDAESEGAFLQTNL